MIPLAGTLVADILARPVGDWPKHGNVVSIEEIEVQPGGAVANTGQILERLGVPVSVHATVGSDNLGQITRSLLESWATRSGIQMLTGHRTTATIVAVGQDGDRNFINVPGACDLFRLSEAQVDEDVRLGARALHVGYALILPAFDGHPMKRALHRAKELGILTSLDVTYFDSPLWSTLIDLMPEVDVFCPSLSEAEAITGKSGAAAAAEALERAGVKQFIAVTNGAVIRIPGEFEKTCRHCRPRRSTRLGPATRLSQRCSQLGIVDSIGEQRPEPESPPVRWQLPVENDTKICRAGRKSRR